VPVFSGAPTFAQLILLSQMPLDRFISDMRASGQVKLVDRCYAAVRVADARRDEEMLSSDQYSVVSIKYLLSCGTSVCNIKQYASSYVAPNERELRSGRATSTVYAKSGRYADYRR
jgi:hypothetical protein